MSTSDKLTAKAEKELVKAYQESLSNIYKQFNEIYAKYGKEGTLDFATMTKFNRLKSLEKQINEELYDLAKKNTSTIYMTLSDVYEQEYYYQGFIFETQAQVKLGYTVLNPDVIKASIQNPISGLTLSERLAKNRANIILNVRQQITQGLVQGESYQKMTKRIKDVFEGDIKKSKKVVQTEAHRVQNEGRNASYDHAESKGLQFRKVWVATLDDKTRDTHAELDGQYADKDGLFHIRGLSAEYPGGFGDPAEDINCRCTTRAEFEGYEPKTRAERGEDGKTKIIPYTTYDDWHRNRVINSN